jgi:hypothetical protein
MLEETALCITAKSGARLPPWVKTGHDALKSRCPLYPRKQTSIEPYHVRFVHKQTRALQQDCVAENFAFRHLSQLANIS